MRLLVPRQLPLLRAEKSDMRLGDGDRRPRNVLQVLLRQQFPLGFGGILRAGTRYGGNGLCRVTPVMDSCKQG